MLPNFVVFTRNSLCMKREDSKKNLGYGIHPSSQVNLRLIDWLSEWAGFTSAPTQYRLYGRRFFTGLMTQPTVIGHCAKVGISSSALLQWRMGVWWSFWFGNSFNPANISPGSDADCAKYGRTAVALIKVHFMINYFSPLGAFPMGCPNINH